MTNANDLFQTSHMNGSGEQQDSLTTDERLKAIDKDTYAYLQNDWQRLKGASKQAVEPGIDPIGNPKYRIKMYFVVRRFFCFLHEQSLSTKLEHVTTDMIRIFLERESSQQEGSSVLKTAQRKEVQRRIKEKIELNAFFTRAVQEKVVKINPVKPLGPTNLTPLDLKNLSPQTQIEYEAFNLYIQNCLDKKSFTVHTSKPALSTMRMLLFDVEAFQVMKSDWPAGLDGWFSHPKWVITWLDLLRSRWLYGKSEVKQQKITKKYLNTIRYIWLFLMDQGRTTVHFYENLRYEFEHRNATLDQPSLRIIEGDLKQIDPHTRVYLQTDQQRLQVEVEQVKQTNTSSIKNPGVRLKRYFIIKKFFFFLYRTGESTRLVEITPDIVQKFLNYIYLLPTTKPISAPWINRHNEQGRIHKGELKAFFDRALQGGVISTNPVPGFDGPQKLEPKHWTKQNQADSQGFKHYLDLQVGEGLLSPHTAGRYFLSFRALLYDSEILHLENPDWPLELDGLFADPKWIATWLRQLKNRSMLKTTTLARATVEDYLNGVHHIWLFLLTRKRVSKNFYQNLINEFKVQGRETPKLPGRSARIIEALSEKEEQAIFECIECCETNPILKLRNQAVFITALQTSIRLKGLSTMRIENFKEVEPGVYTCWVQAKRRSYKSKEYLDHLAEDHNDWRDWYMSPQAVAIIGKYLLATGRNWQSRGPVWLQLNGKPLVYKGLQSLIQAWLMRTGCSWTHSHILRHTAIDRLINKYRRPIPEVQNISQHASVDILLEVYAKRAKVDSFRAINQLFTIDDEKITVEELLSSIGADLDQISTDLNLERHKMFGFRRDAEELLASLHRQLGRLTHFLGYQLRPDLVVISPEDYQLVLDILELADTSVESVLGYQPKPQKEILFKMQH